MELKKSESANIEKQRVPLMLIGFLFVGSVVLASFTYTSPVERAQQAQNGQDEADIDFHHQRLHHKLTYHLQFRKKL